MKFLYKAKNSVKYFLQGGMPFEQFGIRYFGPINGHDLEDIINILEIAKREDESCIIHVVTKKGYGFKEAEDNPVKYHGYSPKSGSTNEKRMKSTRQNMAYIHQVQAPHTLLQHALLQCPHH